MRLTAMALVLLAACGDPAPPPVAPVDGRFTLSGQVGDSEGLVLATSAIVPVAPQQLGDADIFLSVTMVIQLRGTHAEGSLCRKGSGVTQIADISTDVADCAWSYAGLGGNFPHDGEAAGDAYLVRDRPGEALYRLLMVDDRVDATNVAMATFDVSPIARQ